MEFYQRYIKLAIGIAASLVAVFLMLQLTSVKAHLPALEDIFSEYAPEYRGAVMDITPLDPASLKGGGGKEQEGSESQAQKTGSNKSAANYLNYVSPGSGLRGDSVDVNLVFNQILFDQNTSTANFFFQISQASPTVNIQATNLMIQSTSQLSSQFRIPGFAPTGDYNVQIFYQQGSNVSEIADLAQGFHVNAQGIISSSFTYVGPTNSQLDVTATTTSAIANPNNKTAATVIWIQPSSGSPTAITPASQSLVSTQKVEASFDQADLDPITPGLIDLYVKLANGDTVHQDNAFRLTKTTGREEPSSPFQRLQIAPNPISGTATVSWPQQGSEPVHFEVFDVQGKKVMERSNIRGNSFELDRRGIRDGVYIYRIRSESGWQKQGRLLFR
jgi:hypothetical protein